jgi:hypothetical protein
MRTGACRGKGTSHVLAKIAGVTFALLALADTIKWSDRIPQSGFNLYKKIHNAPSQ